MKRVFNTILTSGCKFVIHLEMKQQARNHKLTYSQGFSCFQQTFTTNIILKTAKCLKKMNKISISKFNLVFYDNAKYIKDLLRIAQLHSSS